MFQLTWTSLLAEQIVQSCSAQISLNWGTEKQTVVHYHGILCSHKKERTTDTLNDMDGSQMPNDKWRKTNAKNCRVCDSLCMTLWKRQNYKDFFIFRLRWWLRDCIHLPKIAEMYCKGVNNTICKLYFSFLNRRKILSCLSILLTSLEMSCLMIFR